MDYEQILDDLKNFETDLVECKTSFIKDDFGKTMAAFSTKKGGKIYLGVNDKREPIGVIWNQDLKDKITQVSRVCFPSVCIGITNVNHDSERVIACINIPKGNGSVYSYKRIPYERREGINHPLTPDEVIEIQKRNKKLYFDEMPARSNQRPGLMNDLDIQKVKDYFQNTKGKVPESLDLKQFLINNELSINNSGKVKNAAIMFFGKNPLQFIPQNKVSISIFPSDEEVTSDFIKSEISGCIEEVIKRSFIEVWRNVRVFSKVKSLKRIDIPEYPSEAIREAITNAIVHRDYFIENTEVFIKIFKNRIEITNPGGFPFAGLSWEEVEKSGLSIRRNPIIAKFLEKLNIMEQEGHGIKRIKSYLKAHGLKEPKIETTKNTFKIILFGVEGDMNQVIKSPFKRILDATQLNDRQIKIIQHLRKKENSSISRKECSKLLEIESRTALRELQKLLKMGFVSPIGSKRSTRYILSYT